MSGDESTDLELPASDAETSVYVGEDSARGGNHTRVHKFNPKDIPTIGRLFIYGRTGFGKTTVITDFLHTKRHSFERALVMVGSIGAKMHYEKIFPEITVMYGWHPDRLQRLIDYQSSRVQLGDKTPLLVLMDDMMYQASNFINSKPIRWLLFNGRNALIALWISAQYCMDLPPAARGQLDLFVGCAEKLKPNRERIYKYLNPCFSTLADFDMVYKACTQNYEVVVFNMRSKSTDIQDNVFWYKSEPAPGKFRWKDGIDFDGNKKQELVPLFKMGPNGSWWEYNNKHFDKSYFLGKLRGAGAEVPVVEKIGCKHKHDPKRTSKRKKGHKKRKREKKRE
jgi:hypothetical protein